MTTPDDADRTSNRPNPARSGRGRFIATPETAERDAAAARLRGQGLTLQQIADQLGYASRSSVHDAVKRALAAAPAAAGAELRERSERRLALAYELAQEIAERDHVVVSHGKIVYGEDGQPLRDSGAELAALDRMVRIDAETRKLHGLDQPVKVEQSGSVRYVVDGVDLGALS